MRITELTTPAGATPEEQQQVILDAIAELEEQHRDGIMTDHAYLTKKRMLVRML